ncbi:MAG: hypothetical protein JNM13_03055 [Hyphomicrobiaceae bacterium]|nr:hypothetical protein [Hyphomicrobiaceae bacterium]
MDEAAHAAHFTTVADAVGLRLRQIQAEVERVVPDARRCIGYKMPAFRRRRIFFYFAGFKQHIGIYPPLSGPPELVAELAPWRGPKGNPAFPHKHPLPIDLIGRVAAALAEQYG